MGCEDSEGLLGCLCVRLKEAVSQLDPVVSQYGDIP